MGEIFFLSLISLLLFFGPALAAIAIRRSLSIPWQLVLLVICILYAAFPILIGLGGVGLAKVYNCTTDINIYKCPGNPSLGETITLMTFAHLLAIITIPSGILGIIGMLISLVIKFVKLRKGEETSQAPFAIFYRSRRHKLIAGICSAIAKKTNLPLLAVRIVTVILAIVAPGFGAPLYLWLWLAFPLEPNS
ncbi:PspC domain-containing protein [Aerosakkonemataceae cyanobacterium BLCC-F154]|uniref:PspC domain-containing protein n=1 Tax=Floridaenema fluviatile BLCC-F154 TaxID=3153640 RepID=A0ABV4Y9D3_9CYAN